MDIFDKKAAREQQRILQRKSENLIKLYPELTGYLDRYEDPSRRALLIQQRLAAGVPLPTALLKAQKKKKRRAKRTKALRGDLAQNLTAQKRYRQGERRERDTEEPRIVGEPRQQPVNIYFGGAPAGAAAPGAPVAGAPPVAPAVAIGPAGGFGGGGGGGGLPPGPPGGFGGGGGGAPALDVAGLRRGIVADIAARLPAPADMDPIREEIRAGYADLRRGMGEGELRRQAQEQGIDQAIRAFGADIGEIERRRAEGERGIAEQFRAQQEGFGEGLRVLAEGQGDILGGQEAFGGRIDAIRGAQDEQAELLRRGAEGQEAMGRAIQARLDAQDLETRQANRRRQDERGAIFDRIGHNDDMFDALRQEAQAAFQHIDHLRGVERAIAREGGIMTRNDRDELFARQQELLDYFGQGIRELGGEHDASRRQELSHIRNLIRGAGPDPRRSAARPPRGLPHGVQPPYLERPPGEGPSGEPPEGPGGAPGPPPGPPPGPGPPPAEYGPHGRVQLEGYRGPEQDEFPGGGPELEAQEGDFPQLPPAPSGDAEDVEVNPEIEGGVVRGGGELDLPDLDLPPIDFRLVESFNYEDGGTDEEIDETTDEEEDAGGLFEGGNEPGVGNPAQDLPDRDPNAQDVRLEPPAPQPQPEPEPQPEPVSTTPPGSPPPSPGFMVPIEEVSEDTDTEEESPPEPEALPLQESGILIEGGGLSAEQGGQVGFGGGGPPTRPFQPGEQHGGGIQFPVQGPGGQAELEPGFGLGVDEGEGIPAQQLPSVGVGGGLGLTQAERIALGLEQPTGVPVGGNEDDRRPVVAGGGQVEEVEEGPADPQGGGMGEGSGLLDAGPEGLEPYFTPHFHVRDSQRLFDESHSELAGQIRPGPRGDLGYKIVNNTGQPILGIKGNGSQDIVGVETGRKGRGTYRLEGGGRHELDTIEPHIKAGTLLFKKKQDTSGLQGKPAVAKYAAPVFQEELTGGAAGPPAEPPKQLTVGEEIEADIRAIGREQGRLRKELRKSKHVRETTGKSGGGELRETRVIQTELDDTDRRLQDAKTRLQRDTRFRETKKKK